MAGLMTLMEIKKTLTNLNLVWLGPITNVAHSWIEAFMKNLGFSLKIICPKESKEIYEKKCNEYAIDLPKEDIILSDLSEEILNTADAILTDTWVSMGEERSDSYIDKLKDYRVRESIMKKTKNSCTFMHCLPVNRNQEVEASVIDGPSSSVWLEAENRLHIQKEILLDCL
jgi:ornithine carbamoyltransferase